MSIVDDCVAEYQKQKNLKLCGEKLGIPWQTVYVHLKNAGVVVCGDKLRYGSDKDKFAAKAEAEFLLLVPCAINNNEKRFQPKLDFDVLGYGVDVKASNLKAQTEKSKRFSFSIKKQEIFSDFFVFFGYMNESDYRCFLTPSELTKNYALISIPEVGGKWGEFEIDPCKLNEFFLNLPKKTK